MSNDSFNRLIQSSVRLVHKINEKSEITREEMEFVLAVMDYAIDITKLAEGDDK